MLVRIAGRRSCLRTKPSASEPTAAQPRRRRRRLARRPLDFDTAGPPSDAAAMATADVLFIAVCHNVSFVGKTWWVSTLLLRLLVLLLTGFDLFADERERFICNTIQPGCSNACMDAFAPVSVFHLWLLHLLLLILTHSMFATYVAHRVMLSRRSEALLCQRSPGASPFALGTPGSSGEVSLNKAPLHGRQSSARRFDRAYVLVVTLRILLEAAFGIGQFFLFGLSMPKSFLCYEAPCTSGVECYVFRPKEKTLMLNFMLAAASLSVLLSLVDLASSAKATVSRRREMLAEEINQGEQNSVFTASAMEETEVLPTRRTSPSGSSKNGLRVDKAPPAGEPFRAGAPAGGSPSANKKLPQGNEKKDPNAQPAVLGHPRPPPSPRSERASKSTAVKMPATFSSNSSQQPESPKDKRAWV